MAQTVAVQRGTTTASSQSRTTLFTQSGGISTRVILNQVAWYFSSGPGNNQQHQLLHVSSSGPVTLIGYYNSGQLGGISGQMMPNSDASLNANSGMLYGVGGTANWPGSDFVSVNSGYGQSYMPQNYWIGPGDSIAFLQYNNSGYSATVGYHFTTITES
jgi:hypothetical protein